MQEYFSKNVHMANVDKLTMEFRFNTVLMLADAGIALNKVETMRPQLEKMSKLRLTSTSHLRELIKPLLEHELVTLKEELEGKWVMVIFDGTTNVDKVFGIIFRYVTDTFDIRHRVVAMEKYQASLSHENLYPVM